MIKLFGCGRARSGSDFEVEIESLLLVLSFSEESYAQRLGEEGTICLVNNGSTQYLHGVQYVPGAANLLSVSKAVKEGLWFTHHHKGEPVCAHNPKAGFSCELRKQGGMYAVEILVLSHL